MTIAATYFQCKEDHLLYADPIYYGENWTVLLDEDGCQIWTVPGTDPAVVLNQLGFTIIEGSIKEAGYRGSRAFKIQINGRRKYIFKQAITYTFVNNGMVPKPHHNKKGRTPAELTK